MFGSVAGAELCFCAKHIGTLWPERDRREQVIIGAMNERGVPHKPEGVILIGEPSRVLHEHDLAPLFHGTLVDPMWRMTTERDVFLDIRLVATNLVVVVDHANATSTDGERLARELLRTERAHRFAVIVT